MSRAEFAGLITPEALAASEPAVTAWRGSGEVRVVAVELLSADGRSSKGDTYTLYRIDGGQR